MRGVGLDTTSSLARVSIIGLMLHRQNSAESRFSLLSDSQKQLDYLLLAQALQHDVLHDVCSLSEPTRETRE